MNTKTDDRIKNNKFIGFWMDVMNKEKKYINTFLSIYIITMCIIIVLVILITYLAVTYDKNNKNPNKGDIIGPGGIHQNPDSLFVGPGGIHQNPDSLFVGPGGRNPIQPEEDKVSILKKINYLTR